MLRVSQPRYAVLPALPAVAARLCVSMYEWMVCSHAACFGCGPCEQAQRWTCLAVCMCESERKGLFI